MIVMMMMMIVMMNDDNDDDDGDDGGGYLYVRGWVPLFRDARGLARDGIRD